MRSMVTVTFVGVVVVMPESGEIVIQDLAEEILQLRVPPPLLEIVSVFWVSCSLKDKLVVLTLSSAGGGWCCCIILRTLQQEN